VAKDALAVGRAGDVTCGVVTSMGGVAGHGHVVMVEGRVWGALPLAGVGALGVDLTPSWDGIVIGPSIVVGKSEIGGAITSDALLVAVGATAMLGARSAYGSIGRMSPEGPAPRERSERLGNAAGVLELDAGGSAAEAVALARFASVGSTIQRPAA